jgi:hypothetical protein
MKRLKWQNACETLKPETLLLLLGVLERELAYVEAVLQPTLAL